MAKSFGLKDPMAIANAAGITTSIVFVVCRLLVGIFPDFMFTVGQSWLHGIHLTQMGTWNLTMSTFILGFISSSAFAWIVGYLFAVIYSTFIDRR